MTLGQLARMSGRGALVLRKMEINEAGPNFVHIEGRSAGILSWLCTVVGVDNDNGQVRGRKILSVRECHNENQRCRK